MKWPFYVKKREEIVAGNTSKKEDVAGGDWRNNVEYVNTSESATKIAAVYRAVNLISSSAAVLTMRYMRRDTAQNYFKLCEDAEGNTINYLLAVRPNERQNAYTMFKYLVAQILLKGNAYVLPEYDGAMRLQRLVLLTPGAVVYDKLQNSYLISDEVNGISRLCRADEILHFKNFCSDGGYLGVSTISYAATTLGIAATADKETLRRFGTGGRFKAILQNNKSLKGLGEYDDDEFKGAGEDLQESLNRGDDILVLKGDGELTPISMSSADMQFLESRKFTIREIARFFNVPPSKLMDDSNSNYKSVETSNIAFFAEALQPIVTEIEREFNAKLLNVKTWRNYKFKFDISAIYALDLESRAKWDKSRLENGQCSVNDIRRENDKAPVEKGDEIYLSVNFAPLGSTKLSGEKVEEQPKQEP
jgi:HK97 family phage portal protein